MKGGALNLNLNGEFAAIVDEIGVMNYHPYRIGKKHLEELYISWYN